MPPPKDPEKLKEYLRKQSEARKGKPGPNKGRKFSEEHKAKLAATKLGKPGPWLGKHRDEETKTKISENLKGIKPSPERYSRQLEGIQRHTENITPEQREKMAHRLGLHNTEEHKRRQSEALMGRTVPEHVIQLGHSPEANAKRGAAHKKIWAAMPPEEKARRTKRFVEAGRKSGKNQNTNIERFVAKQLDAFQIVYERQNRIGLYSVDFFIPADNLIIEVNGCFWHGCEECGFNEEMHIVKRAHDVKRTTYLEAKGYTVGVVWQHDLEPHMEELEK